MVAWHSVVAVAAMLFVTMRSLVLLLWRLKCCGYPCGSLVLMLLVVVVVVIIVVVVGFVVIVVVVVLRVVVVAIAVVAVGLRWRCWWWWSMCSPWQDADCCRGIRCRCKAVADDACRPATQRMAACCAGLLCCVQ